MKTRWLYFAHGRDTDHVKIGITDHVRRRMKQLGCTIYFAVKCDEQTAPILERAFHTELADQRLGRSEWFVLDDRTRKLIRYVRLKRRWPWSDQKVIVE